MIETQEQAIASQPAVRAQRWIWIGVLLILVLNAAVRWRLRDFPLERDEGEFAYTGQLMLQGIPPYKLAYFMKLPGTHAAYALIMAIFGQTAAGIHTGLLVMNTATLIMIFFLGKRLLDATGGFFACAAYVLLCTSPAVYGFQAHATQFGIFFALAGLLTLYRAEDSARLLVYFLSGVLFGIAILMKQPVALFAVFAALLIVWLESFKLPIKWKTCGARVLAYSAGVLAPYLLTCLILWHAGVFDRFWYWTVTNVRIYSDRIPLLMGYQILLAYFKEFPICNLLLWMLGGTGFFLLLKDNRAGRGKPVILLLTLCSAAATSAGLYFRPHYFVLMLPALSLLIAAGLASGRRLLAQPGINKAAADIPMIVFALVAIFTVSTWRDFFFRYTPDEASEYNYGDNPFIEMREFAREIAARTTKDDRIVVIGSEPEIYFYANRLSGSGYIYTYDMMVPNAGAHALQVDFIHQIEASKPKILAVVKLPGSWGPEVGKSDPSILDWAALYCQNQYDLIGAMDFDQPRPRKLLLDTDIAHYPLSNTGEYVFLFQRKPDAGG